VTFVAIRRIPSLANFCVIGCPKHVSISSDEEVIEMFKEEPGKESRKKRK
jgi:hypothetical protein